jgi:hypothetical protein
MVFDDIYNLELQADLGLNDCIFYKPFICPSFYSLLPQVDC